MQYKISLVTIRYKKAQNIILFQQSRSFQNVLRLRKQYNLNQSSFRQMNQQEKLQHMYSISLASRKNAYCPYSNFSVGSCVLGANGNFYSGCNVQNAIDTVCAERLALLKMVENGCREIKELYVVTKNQGEKITPPCGFCRQYLKEFSKNDDQVMIHVGSVANGHQKSYSLSELYPFPFNPPPKAQNSK